MSLDEKVYSDPFSFDPTRYLPKPMGKGEPYPAATFGFGRRCVHLLAYYFVNLLKAYSS